MLKILFITQKVDREDDVLGVYHEWLKRLAGQVERLNIICLYRGAADLPDNAPVFSLGKEKSVSNWKYLKNFYTYIFRLRPNYDLVFVHMNPTYILLGWLPWKLWGKRIIYWNASYKISPRMKLAAWLADQRLTSVLEAFAVRQPVIAVGQGIDTELFKPDPTAQRLTNSILFLGRIAPVKNLEVLITAAQLLYQRGVLFHLDIAGEPDSEYQPYFAKMKRQAQTLGRAGLIRFLGRVPNYQTPRLYNSRQVFVNLTASNSFDKSILEAMACQTLALVSNSVYQKIFPEALRPLLLFRENDPLDLADKLERLLPLPVQASETIGGQLREIVVRSHGLNKLTDKLIRTLEEL